MDNEYGSMLKQLMNERNELRKYIIDICNLLYIDASQSVLGANCLEFYAVLCSTAENKIKDLQEQLKRKEEECEGLKQALDKLIPILEYYATSTIGLKQVDGTYKFVYGANNFGDELCLNYDPRLAIEGLNIINKTKEGK